MRCSTQLNYSWKHVAFYNPLTTLFFSVSSWFTTSFSHMLHFLLASLLLFNLFFWLGHCRCLLLQLSLPCFKWLICSSLLLSPPLVKSDSTVVTGTSLYGWILWQTAVQFANVWPTLWLIAVTPLTHSFLTHHGSPIDVSVGNYNKCTDCIISCKSK